MHRIAEQRDCRFCLSHARAKRHSMTDFKKRVDAKENTVFKKSEDPRRVSRRALLFAAQGSHCHHLLGRLHL